MLGNKLMAILIAGILLLTACGGNSADLTPTADPNALSTQVIATFSAALTQTAIAQPTIQLFPTLTASPTFAPFATSAATLPPISQATIAPTKSCYSMAFVSDVTIPDNTPMTPGQTFNVEQRARWNGVDGEYWAREQDKLDRMLEPVVAPLLEFAQPVEGSTVLDVGCGCGVTTVELARLVGKRGKVAWPGASCGIRGG